MSKFELRIIFVEDDQTFKDFFSTKRQALDYAAKNYPNNDFIIREVDFSE